MQITVTAPNRLDLAGGTTDLYPLYLLMEGGGCTVNVAVSIKSTVRLRSLEKHRFRIVSEDLNASTECSSLENIPIKGHLALLGRAIKALPPEAGLEVIARNEAPAGSGLGASSALLMALIQGLLRLSSEELELPSMISLAVNIETSVIGVPAGSQDHIAAAYGGISVINFGHRGFSRKTVDKDPTILQELNDMLILSYTGLGRFSGMNNWEITKSFIDGVAGVRDKLVEIRDIAAKTGEALVSGELNKLAHLIDAEWQIRRTLAAGVSTPRIESIMKAANRAGALANKICGAGGGGCMITLVEPDRKVHVQQAITQAGGEVLHAILETTGLEMRFSQ